MILRPYWLLAAALPIALADVKFTLPTAGATVTGGTISIKWEDSGSSPSISDLTGYQLFLCAGGNAEGSYVQLATLVTTGDFTTGNSASGVITQGLGASKPANAYFLKMISAATGGTVENFSPRFTLSGLDGVFPSAVTAGLVDVSGTSGPATVNNVANPQQAAPGAGTAEVAGGQYSVAYTAQTGLSRYAPMPPIPGTQITAKNASPQFPTSAFTPYPSAAGSPNAVTTMTASETQHASSIENPASAVGNPTDTAMSRFLNRWKD